MWKVNNLYKDLRCGFAHCVRPQGKISLTEKKHIKNINCQHLGSVQSGNLILVAEDFYTDFVAACEKVITKIEKLDHTLDKKAYNDFLSVPADNANDTSSINKYPASGASDKGVPAQMCATSSPFK